MATDFSGADGYLGTFNGMPVIVNPALRSTDIFIIDGEKVIMSPANLARVMELKDRPSSADQEALVTLLDHLIREIEESSW